MKCNICKQVKTSFQPVMTKSGVVMICKECYEGEKLGPYCAKCIRSKMNKKDTIKEAIGDIYMMFTPYGTTPTAIELKDIIGWVYDQGKSK